MLGEAAAAVEQVRAAASSRAASRSLDLEVSAPLSATPATSIAPLRRVVHADARRPTATIVGVSAVVIDVTDRRRALDARARGGARARAFMAEAGAVLDASMDYGELLSSLARLAVPGFADWCVVSLRRRRRRPRQVAVAHADPVSERFAREMADRYPLARPTRVGKVAAPRAARGRRRRHRRAAGAARDDEHLAMLQRSACTPASTVPLVARGRTLGDDRFVAAESGRRYDDADVQLLVELGRRAGVAIDNARLYTERSRIAHTLQARLLPGRLPTPPGVRLAARYRAAGEFNEVGGDFYDAFQRVAERVGRRDRRRVRQGRRRRPR